MAVTVTENFVDETNSAAEAATGWTSSDSPDQTTGFQREGTNCMGMGANNSDEDSYLGISSTDFSGGRTVFGWMYNGVPGTTANIGFGIILGDGTNTRAYGVGGNDNYGHFVKGWSGFRLDSLQLPADTRNINGAGAPSLSAITQIGYSMNYAIGAFGKINNVFYDVIRHIANGSAALSISGGTSGDKGTWAEIVADDESTSAGKAYGVMRTLTAGSKAYELTYGIEFGAATGDTYFEDDNFQLVIVGSGMSAGNMDINLISGTGTNYFSLQDGVIAGVGTVSNWGMKDPFDTLLFNRMTCSDLGTIQFPGSGGTIRESRDCVFNNCGQVSFGRTFPLTGASFNGTTDANGALLLDSATNASELDALSFLSDGSGHAIYITASGTYDFNDFVFSGYATVDGSTGDEVIYNDSGGAVTINVTGGSGTVSVRNGTGASTNVVSGAVTVKAVITTDTGSPVTDARVHIEAAGDAADPFPTADVVTIVNSGTTATVTHTAHGMATNDKVVIRGGTIDANKGVFTITVTGANTYTYTMLSTPGSSPTGTITSTFVLISGVTDTTGILTMTRVFSADQPVSGRARKASGAPYYKNGPIVGTVNSSTGATLSAVMISDD